MTTALTLDEWLDLNILEARREQPTARPHDTAPPVARQKPQPGKKKPTRTVRREETRLAAKRARHEQRRARKSEGVYPGDS